MVEGVVDYVEEDQEDQEVDQEDQEVVMRGRKQHPAATRVIGER